MFSLESPCKGELPIYTLPLNLAGGPPSVGLTTTFMAGVDISLPHEMQPAFLVTITEYDFNQHIRWVYSFRDLHLNDDVSVHGIVYKISAIKYSHQEVVSSSASVKAEHHSIDQSSGIVGTCSSHCNDFINVTKTDRLISDAGAEAIVLTHSSLNTLYFGECNVGVALIGIESDPVNGDVATVRLQKLGYNSNNKNVCGTVKSTSYEKVFVGHVVSFPGAGSFVIKSILPSTPDHGDWIVMVPIEG